LSALLVNHRYSGGNLVGRASSTKSAHNGIPRSNAPGVGEAEDMKCAGAFQTRKAIQGRPGERKFGQRRQIVDEGTGAVDVQMSEPVQPSQEVRTPQNSVVPDDECAHSPGKQDGTERGGVEVAHDRLRHERTTGGRQPGLLGDAERNQPWGCGT
jgi:hypothetical protein